MYIDMQGPDDFLLPLVIGLTTGMPKRVVRLKATSEGEGTHIIYICTSVQTEAGLDILQYLIQV
jgi:hypothetical protein